MARGIIRKPSFWKIVGAYRSQWKRFWMRLFTFGAYGRKGMGWWKDPKKAWYNFWYYRTSISVYRVFGCKPSRLAYFFALIVACAVGIVIVPVDATRGAAKAYKIKKARKARAQKKTSTASTRPATNKTTRATGTRTSQNTSPRTTASKAAVAESMSVKKTATPKSKATTSHVQSTASASYRYPDASLYPKPEPIGPLPPEPEAPKEPDENTPKSRPKYEKDQYIRKRMIIAGSSYCDEAVLAKLQIGTYFDLLREPNNPYDKNAVVLTYEGEKIGYVAKKDVAPFAVCLNLRREIYGVITDIVTENGFTKYEYETWFNEGVARTTQTQ